MQTKLTLRLDEALIKAAKQEGKRAGKSVSQMVSDYFAAFQKVPTEGFDSAKLAPLTRSMTGVLKGSKKSRGDGRYELLLSKHAKHVSSRLD